MAQGHGNLGPVRGPPAGGGLIRLSAASGSLRLPVVRSLSSGAQVRVTGQQPVAGQVLMVSPGLRYQL